MAKLPRVFRQSAFVGRKKPIASCRSRGVEKRQRLMDGWIEKKSERGRQRRSRVRGRGVLQTQCDVWVFFLFIFVADGKKMAREMLRWWQEGRTVNTGWKRETSDELFLRGAAVICWNTHCILSYYQCMWAAGVPNHEIQKPMESHQTFKRECLSWWRSVPGATVCGADNYEFVLSCNSGVSLHPALSLPVSAINQPFPFAFFSTLTPSLPLRLHAHFCHLYTWHTPLSFLLSSRGFYLS